MSVHACSFLPFFFFYPCDWILQSFFFGCLDLETLNSLDWTLTWKITYTRLELQFLLYLFLLLCWYESIRNPTTPTLLPIHVFFFSAIKSGSCKYLPVNKGKGMHLIHPNSWLRLRQWDLPQVSDSTLLPSEHEGRTGNRKSCPAIPLTKLPIINNL